MYSTWILPICLTYPLIPTLGLYFLFASELPSRSRTRTVSSRFNVFILDFSYLFVIVKMRFCYCTLDQAAFGRTSIQLVVSYRTVPRNLVGSANCKVACSRNIINDLRKKRENIKCGFHCPSTCTTAMTQFGSMSFLALSVIVEPQSITFVTATWAQLPQGHGNQSPQSWRGHWIIRPQ